MADKPTYVELKKRVAQLEKEAGDRERIEIMLRESEERSRQLVKLAPTGILEVDILNQRIKNVNDDMCKHIGYTREEVLSLNPIDVMVGDSKERYKKRLADILGGKEVPETFEYKVKGKDGRELWAVLNSRIKYENGIPESAIIVAHDITERKKAEESIRESEEKYRVLFQSSVTGTCLFELSGKILDINEHAARSLGYDRPEELIGKNILDFYNNQNEREKVFNEITQGDIHAFELEFVRNDGSALIAAVSVSLMELNGEKVILSSGEDVTDRKKAEEALRKSEERHRSIFENTGAAIVIFEDDMTISMMNAEYEKLSGFSREEVEGKMKWTKFVAAEDLDKMKSYHAQRSKGSFDVPREYEFQFMDRYGNTNDIFLKVDMIPGTQRRVASLMDITSRKQAEKALRESEEKYRTLFEDSRDAIFVSNKEGELVDVNRSALKLIRYNREEAIGLDVLDLYAHSDDRSKLQRKIIEEGYVRDYEMRFRKKDQGEMDCLLTATVQRTKEGEIEGIQGIVRDISEKKELEAQFLQAQKMEAVGTLAGGIAHDFNNMLMGIQGRTSLMLMDTDSTHLHYEHLKGVEEYVKSAANLTKQLLGFARGGKYEVRPTDINELVKRQNRMFGRTKKEINIQGKYEKNLWTAEVDQGQMEQVLLNLYVNAWQAMPGGGKLYVQTENVSLNEDYIKPYQVESGKYVKISITDTGIGMDEATQQRIFEPFFTTKEMGRGTGLGLATVYGITKNHGGFINVYSEKDMGTTFNIYLPASGKDIIKEGELYKEIMKGTETLLLVDDEAVIIDVNKQLLEQIGYHVLVANNGQEAVDIYEENKDRIDIVLLDMIMPDMEGGLVYDTLKGMNPNVKVLLSSGYSINGHATEIMNRGCNGFLQKPFSMKDLSQKLRDILDKH